MYIPIEFKDLKENYLLIDVRSPSEYKHSTINGAINIPIFDDYERKVIGTVYINESVEKAKKIGVDVASKKLPEIYEKVIKLKENYDKLVFFCARGGMRSGVLTMFLTAMGINAVKLKGGYKAYRKYIVNELPKINKNINYIVLHGNTGVGKTEILKKLKLHGYDVLDLEGAANHRGSLLGNVGLGDTYSQKQFESNIYHTLEKIKTNHVFVEGESSKIGNINVPKFICDKMKEGIHIFLDADIDFRVNIIVNEYIKDENNKIEIFNCLDKLNKYISRSNLEKYKTLLEKENYNELAKELMEKYYDPLYMNSAKNYDYVLKVNVDNIDKSAEIIENWFKRL